MSRSSFVRLAARAVLLSAVLPAIGCGYDSPTAPDMSDGEPGPPGATIAITASGLTPRMVSIAAGQSVTFVNNDTVAHEIVSEPVPTYADCPGINRVSRLEPGESTETSALTASRTCGFLDLLRTDDGRWQGTIVVQ